MIVTIIDDTGQEHKYGVKDYKDAEQEFERYLTVLWGTIKNRIRQLQTGEW